MVLVSKRRRGLQFLKVIQLFQINHETYCWELAVSTVDLILRGGSTNDTWGAKAYKTFSDHFYHHRVHDKHWQLGEEPSLISLATIDHDSIYDPGSRFATTPPPPHGMVPKPAFCSIPHENVVFAVFFAWWVAGAVRNPANSLDFCNQPSENVLFAMFRLRHRGVVPPRPLLFLCQIIT